MPNINTDKVCYLIIKAREFDVKVDPVIPDPGGNPTDDGSLAILSDYSDDPTYRELTEFFASLNVEELCNLQALAWVGRGDFTSGEWDAAMAEAGRVAGARTGDYLLGLPLLSDYLEEALSQFGLNCHDFEMGHL